MNAVRQACWEMTGGRCFYCSAALTSDNMHVDHRVSPKRGGRTRPENLVPACHVCNIRKGQRTPSEYRVALMLSEGRPPIPFFGELQEPDRDWVIVCSEVRRRDLATEFAAYGGIDLDAADTA
jgi:hypothetical protein